MLILFAGVGIWPHQGVVRSSHSEPFLVPQKSLQRRQRVARQGREISGLALSEFVEHLGRLGIEIVRQDETTSNETGNLTPWLAS